MDRTNEVVESEETTQLQRDAAAYLSRCQVDTPHALVRLVWDLVNERRPNAGHVVDIGCGDARFSRAGTYASYTGFEIDKRRAQGADTDLVRIQCAFAARKTTAAYDACVGNPPYVRHHQLSAEWLARAERRLGRVDAYKSDGRSNAYVYFMWLALDYVRDDGLVALVVPYEWVSRPASEPLRQYIAARGWSVDIYYLNDANFERVLTTACVTIIDKSRSAQSWQLHEMRADGTELRQSKHVTRTPHERLPYERAQTETYAMRGLSPGSRKHFVLTEEERVHHRLEVNVDVVPAVTSFRHLQSSQNALTEHLFRSEFVNNGKRCWLVNPTDEPSAQLVQYLKRVPSEVRQNFTCANRAVWWRFEVPAIADILYASGFKTAAPKMFRNEVGAVHVGAIHAVYCRPRSVATALLTKLRSYNFADRVVPLSNGFLKVEVKQMNAVLNRLMKALQP